ncbi:MAG TPA: ABC transporter permease [Candidatus Methylomirabilis sp.]|nr:ABC transporter permease [Candidatus Methylomirabilis sp.]
MSAPVATSPAPTAVRELGGRRSSRFQSGDPVVLGAFLVLATIALCALMPATLAPHPPNQQQITMRLRPPVWMARGNPAHPLGTDQLGRDILSRVIHGARISLIVALSALAISGTIGVTIGLVAGYYRGWLDDWIMRIADVQLSIPYVLLAIAIIAVIGPTNRNVVLVLALNGWVVYARLARGQALSLREREFIQAYRALGARDWRIVLQHILPNLVSAVIVVGSLELAGIITLESSLSFLGLGIQPPTVSWGFMLADGRTYLLGGAWWVVTFPGLAITAIVLSINVLADWLRDVLDPRLKL